MRIEHDGNLRQRFITTRTRVAEEAFVAHVYGADSKTVWWLDDLQSPALQQEETAGPPPGQAASRKPQAEAPPMQASTGTTQGST